jgi:O-antigen/teichoic acid export membrane protein
LRFSIWVSLTRYLRTLNGYIDFIVIGRLIDLATLGLYQMAWRVSFVLTNAFNNMAVPQITFSSFARIQDDTPRMRRGYRQMTELLLSLALPLAAGLAVISAPLTHVLLGEKWTGAIAPMQILAVAAGVRAFRSQASWVTVGAGRSRIVFFRDIVVTIALVSALFVLVPEYGATGAAWAVLISVSVAIPLHAYDLRRLLGVGIGDILSPVLWPLVFTGSVVAAGMLASALMGATSIGSLVVTAAMIAVAYLGTVLAANAWFGHGPLSVVFARRMDGEAIV